MAQVTEYVDERGRRPFGRWFDHLDSNAAIKVTAVLDRMGRGLLSSAKGVGEGVFEYRIDAAKALWRDYRHGNAGGMRRWP